MTTATKGARCIRYGQGHGYQLDGRKIPGVTTIISQGLPKPALVSWAARETAEYIASRRNVLLELDNSELIDLCKNAPNRKRDSAAVRGSEIHKMAQRLATGEEVEIKEEIRGHVDSYLAFLETFQPYNALVELPVFSRTYGYGGTLDLLAETDHPTVKGRTLFDFKTSGSGIYGEIALQLAGYGQAEFYAQTPNWEEFPMPHIDHYVGVWLRADGFDAYPIEVTERERKTFLYVAQVAWWMGNRKDIVRRDAMVLPREGAGTL